MKQIIYKFKDIDNLYCDLNGNFFFNNKPISKIYNNGTLSIRCGKTKKGLKKLRKLAYKSEIEIEVIPF